MKHSFAILLFFWSVAATAQEQNPPVAIPGAASEFLRDFQNAVKYLADKTIPRPRRMQFAASFAKTFAPDAVIQVMNGNDKITLTPKNYFERLIDLNYDTVEIGFTVNKQSPFKKTTDNWWTTQYEITQSFTGSRNGKPVAEDFTIKTIDLYFLYTAATNSWTKKYGNVRAHSSQKPKPKPKRRGS
jgi:hypothetical protein